VNYFHKQAKTSTPSQSQADPFCFFVEFSIVGEKMFNNNFGSYFRLFRIQNTFPMQRLKASTGPHMLFLCHLSRGVEPRASMPEAHPSWPIKNVPECTKKTSRVHTQTKVNLLPSFSSLSCHSVFLSQSGELMAWGVNSSGSCGVGHSETVVGPEKVVMPAGVESVSMLAAGM
jgi:hypothetical protein